MSILANLDLEFPTNLKRLLQWVKSNPCHDQGLTGSRYLTRPELFLKYPTRPDPKIENDWVPGNKISF